MTAPVPAAPDRDEGTVDGVTPHPFDPFRRAIVEALELTYGSPEMFGNTRYPTDAEIVSWVSIERKRVNRMHQGHHADVVGFCPVCGMYGKKKRDA